MRFLSSIFLYILFLAACQPADPPAMTLAEKAAKDSTSNYNHEDLFERKKIPLVDMKPLLFSYEESDSIRLYEALSKITKLQSRPLSYKLIRSDLYGYQDSIYILECRFPKDSICEHYPFVQQFIFDAEANFLADYRASSLDFIRLQDSAAVMLLLTETDCEGKGEHQILRWEAESLVNIFSPMSDDYPPTLEKGLRSEWQLKDLNQDSLNDIVFRVSGLKNGEAIKRELSFEYRKAKDMYIYRN